MKPADSEAGFERVLKDVANVNRTGEMSSSKRVERFSENRCDLWKTMKLFYSEPDAAIGVT